MSNPSTDLLYSVLHRLVADDTSFSTELERDTFLSAVDAAAVDAGATVHVKGADVAEAVKALQDAAAPPPEQAAPVSASPESASPTPVDGAPAAPAATLAATSSVYTPPQG